VAAGAGGDRYSRQTRFAELGPQGQERLRAARVTVIGCGALGGAGVALLARAGVGHLRVADRDVVELSNLQRQLLFEEADAAEGAPKAVAAARAVARINSEVEVEPVVTDVTAANVEGLLDGAEVVLDGTDNFETRYLVNDACVKAGLPWVYGGVVGATGMVMPVRPGASACFRCLYPEPPAAGTVETCDTAGVLGASVAAVAAEQWIAVVRILLGREAGLYRLSAFDLWTGDHHAAEVPRREGCPCCGGRRFEFLEARATSRTAALCGRDAVQVSPAAPQRLDLAQLAERLGGAGELRARTAHLLRFAAGGHELTVFQDGRAIVKGTSDPGVARTLYARYVGV